MKKYRVSIIVRTLETYEVEAEDAEQAEDNLWDGTLICTDDNLESEILSVEAIKATGQDKTPSERNCKMTTKVKHTASPWIAEAGRQINLTPNKEAAYRIKTIEIQTPISPGTSKTLAFIPADEPEAEANVRLITAAPDLLKALDYLLEQTIDQDLKYGIGLSEGEEDARGKALAAIAKATGQEVGL